MRAIYSRWLPCATLAAWSVVLLHFADVPSGPLGKALSFLQPMLLSGRIDSFLIPAFRPWVLIAGLGLLAMSVAFLFFRADAECCTATECAHPMSRVGGGKWLTFAVLLIPIGAAAVATPDSFSQNVMKNRTEVTDVASLRKSAPRQTTMAQPEFPLPTKDGSPAPEPAAQTQPTEQQDFLTRTPEGYIKVEILDMLYAAQDALMRKDFETKTVTLTAQLMPVDQEKPGVARFKAVRMFMTCCAADARPVSTMIETSKLPNLPEMTWVTVIGTATFPIENGRRMALIKATSVEKSAPPDETMLY